MPHKVSKARQAFGWIEKAKIKPEGIVVHAKLDTGAENSSLHAENLVEFEKDGQRWVRFSITNRYGVTTDVERKVVRTTRIKRYGGKYRSRFVVVLGICLGDRYMEADVSLDDRTGFNYQMLIGRSFLAGNATIDPAIMYTVEPQCL